MDLEYTDIVTLGQHGIWCRMTHDIIDVVNKKGVTTPKHRSTSSYLVARPMFKQRATRDHCVTRDEPVLTTVSTSGYGPMFPHVVPASAGAKEHNTSTLSVAHAIASAMGSTHVHHRAGPPTPHIIRALRTL